MNVIICDSSSEKKDRRSEMLRKEVLSAVSAKFSEKFAEYGIKKNENSRLAGFLFDKKTRKCFNNKLDIKLFVHLI